MKKYIKNIFLLMLCVPAFAVCASCGKISAILSKKTTEIVLEDKEPILNLTEKFEWIDYQRQDNDTLSGVEFKFKISPSSINIFEWFDTDWSKTIKIPSMSGIYHQIEESDTVSMLSEKYHVPQEVIINANNIDNEAINEIEYVFIPNPFNPENISDAFRAFGLKEDFIYPVKGIIISSFGWQQVSDTSDTYIFHSGINIRAEAGTQVRVSKTGTVYDVGIDQVYGKYIIIRNDDGYYTFYSNFSNVSARKGSYVRQGYIIGRIDNTGDGDYSYLYFGIFRGYNALNPQRLIRENNDYEYDDDEGYIYQVISDDNGKTAIRIVSYMGQNRVVHIPPAINNLPVKEIGDMAFFERGLTAVTIPHGVTYIGRYAFNSIYRSTYKSFSTNKIRRLDIPETVNFIDDKAFAYNELTHIIIPDSITNIGYGAFEDNKLTKVTIPNNLSVIEDWVFADNKLRSLNIPSNITAIGYRSFDNNKLRKLNLPDSLSVIGSSAFANNQLHSINIPSNITAIEDSAFENNQIKHLKIPDNVISIGAEAFIENKLRSVVIPGSVIEINGMAFINNKITQITIGADVALKKRYASVEFGLDKFGIFDFGFDDFYVSNGSHAGIYVYKNGSWNMQNR